MTDNKSCFTESPSDSYSQPVSRTEELQSQCNRNELVNVGRANVVIPAHVVGWINYVSHYISEMSKFHPMLEILAAKIRIVYMVNKPQMEKNLCVDLDLPRKIYVFKDDRWMPIKKYPLAKQSNLSGFLVSSFWKSGNKKSIWSQSLF